ncbi:MAG TPA: hypothetical protein VMF11_03085 [Candidatus Baltobacteraceae bacterium]|nr:hypothetical protein [Candidatus Baltobacteraceae bacterium]
MLNRYLVRVVLTSLALAASLAAAAPAPTFTPGACSGVRTQLYSARALRRLRTLLQLRLLEARRRRLAAVQAAIEHRATIDQLLALPDDAAVVEGSDDPRLKHLRIASTSKCL